jgi:hypothetical protein
MRIESSVTSISWIPREAVEGLAGVAFDVGLELRPQKWCAGSSLMCVAS